MQISMFCVQFDLHIGAAGVWNMLIETAQWDKPGKLGN